MSSIPAYYPEDMMHSQMITPNTVITQKTGLFRYLQRYLLQKAFSVFTFDLPETWDESYFLYVLYCMGYIGIVDTKQFGVIPQRCGLSGYNIFERPSQCVFASPFYDTMTKTIGRDCVLVKLTPDYCGIMDLVNQYAEMMALTLSGISVNTLNSRLAYVFFAPTKAAAESYKALFDKVLSGEPGVVVSDKLIPTTPNGKMWEPFTQNLRNTYIVPEMLESLKAIENRFATDIGLPNANTDKKERMLMDEVNANNGETFTRCQLWMDTVKKGLQDANKMFGLNLSVRWKVNPAEKEVGKNEGETDDDRAV